MADREMTNEEAIEILSDIRACYNIFDEYDEPKYAALSKAIFALKAEPIHGKWVDKEDPYGFFTIPVCSECGCTTKMRKKYRYCPNCGARMDEVEECE